jgi:hypothetical protein
MHGIVLCVCLAFIFTFDISTSGMRDRAGQVKGTDFVEFYVWGSLARSGRSVDFYDPSVHAAEAVRLVPESATSSYPPVYGPQIALLFAPFASLPYLWALLIWTLVTVSIYMICCAAFWRECAHLRDDWPTVLILACGNPAFFNLILHGQTSALALACVTAAFVALGRDRRVLAGVAIGMLAYKPQLGLVAACVFVVNKEWRVVAGAIAGALAQLGIAWWCYGTAVMLAYAHTVSGLGAMSALLAVKRYQMHSLFAFWKLLLPWGYWAAGLYAPTAIAMTAAAVIIWRARAPLPVRFSFLLLASALVSPHLYVYDLVIVGPALLMSTDWSLDDPDRRRARTLQRWVYCSYALPLLGPVTQITRVQGSVLAMAGLGASVALRLSAESRQTARVSSATVSTAR